jgi:hypothetical protein
MTKQQSHQPSAHNDGNQERLVIMNICQARLRIVIGGETEVAWVDRNPRKLAGSNVVLRRGAA